MKLSIVTTLYHSAPYIREFQERVAACARSITSDCEFVYVNDGSPDQSLRTAVALIAEDPRVRVVDLSRNFGHHQALMAGIAHARGEYVFLIDVDLEEPPECLPVFWRELHQRKVDVVYGYQTERRGPWFQRITGMLYWRLFNFLSDQPVMADILTVRLMSRRFVDALLQHREQLFSIEGLWANTGFDQIPIEVNKIRHKGESTYTLRKKLAYAFQAITAFSTKPLICVAALGALLTASSALYVLFLVGRYLISGTSVGGWTSLIVSLWFFGGLIIFNLGVISTYLAVIFIETKRRPVTIVKHIHEAVAPEIGIRPRESVPAPVPPIRSGSVANLFS